MEALMRALLILALLTMPARAQPRPVDDATKQKAIAHFRQGDEYFKHSQWDNAIREYQAAFDLTGEPLMLFDIAVANDKAGRVELAFDGYNHYLAQVSMGDAAEEARAGKARLQSSVDQIRSDRRAKEKADAEEQAQARAHARAELKASEQRASDEEAHARTLRYAAVAVAGAGVVALGFGVKFGLDARAAADFISTYNQPWTETAL